MEFINTMTNYWWNLHSCIKHGCNFEIFFTINNWLEAVGVLGMRENGDKSFDHIVVSVSLQRPWRRLSRQLRLEPLCSACVKRETPSSWKRLEKSSRRKRKWRKVQHTSLICPRERVRLCISSIACPLPSGIAFPTCVSVNNCVCHYSPLKSDPDIVLKDGDLVKMWAAALVPVHISFFSALFVYVTFSCWMCAVTWAFMSMASSQMWLTASLLGRPRCVVTAV